MKRVSRPKQCRPVISNRFFSNFEASLCHSKIMNEVEGTALTSVRDHVMPGTWTCHLVEFFHQTFPADLSQTRCVMTVTSGTSDMQVICGVWGDTRVCSTVFTVLWACRGSHCAVLRDLCLASRYRAPKLLMLGLSALFLLNGRMQFLGVAR